MTVYSLFTLICIAIAALGSITHIADYIEKKAKSKHRSQGKE